MNHYQSILVKYIAFTSIALLAGIIICIIGIVVTKKLRLEKFFYFLTIALMIFFMIIAIPNLVNCSLDLYYSSYETYEGMCNSPARDTLTLYDENQTKLFSAVSSPSGENQLHVVYSKRSKIALEVVTVD